ncbi:MAG: hypothetical protein U0R49_11470 [Fimbriimonadales bacterium]
MSTCLECERQLSFEEGRDRLPLRISFRVHIYCRNIQLGVPENFGDDKRISSKGCEVRSGKAPKIMKGDWLKTRPSTKAWNRFTQLVRLERLTPTVGEAVG